MQFLGCTTAFIDSLFNALKSAEMFLKKLQGTRKGSAFAFEMQLDQHRYGALLILERWAQFAQAFAGHATIGRHSPILTEAAARVQTAENILTRANQVLDASPDYLEDVVSACVMAYESLNITFAEEKKAAENAAKLGPMLNEEFSDYRRVFLSDLAAR